MKIGDIISLGYEVVDLLDQCPTSLRGVLTITDIPTHLRNRMTDEESHIVLKLMRNRQKKQRKENESSRKNIIVDS
jgi:hypothetical protein